jgi:serine-type D-Ala-D-Ala carboxypeptidase/endopeptidase (penicillin-binding protein 4)
MFDALRALIQPRPLAARQAALALLACGAWGSSMAQAVALPAEVHAALVQAGVGSEALAVLVVPAGAHRVSGPRLAHQAERAMQPGSTMKVVTSVVALDRLGPNHRGRTSLWSAAPQVGDVLQGDWVLKGGADPEFGLPQLWALLQELRFQGIREITGDLIVDRTLFHPARRDQGLPPFDEAPEFEYNVIPDALHLASSLLPLELSSRDAALAVRSLPALPGLRFDTSQVQVVNAPCNTWGDLWQTPQVRSQPNDITVVFTGRFPLDCTRRVNLQVIDRQALTERLVRIVWQQLGGTWNGAAREAATPAGARELAVRQGRPWGELLRHLNKVSDNAWTRLLYLNLGLARMAANPQADTQALAGQEVLAWFAQQGIPTEGLVLDNGSGLSRSERISAAQLVAVLQASRTGPWAPELLMSLPVPGVDGTMRNRLKDSPAAGQARLKTGTLRNVRALAGYVPDVNGRQWVVAAMLNDERAAQARPALDVLVAWIASGGMTRNAAAQAVGPQGEGP